MGPTDSIERHFERFRASKSPRDLAPVFQALAPQLMAAASRAGLDEAGAEDVVQETFLAFIESEGRYEIDRPLVPWVRGIALRQIKAEKRRRARLRMIFRPEGDEEAASDGTDAPESGPMARAELRAKLRKAIQSLSERNGLVVSAAIFDGMSVDEIAQKFELSRSAASVRLHRGLKQVRERLGERSSLALLALTIPRHGDVLPGVLGSTGAVTGALFGGLTGALTGSLSALGVGAAALLLALVAWLSLREVGPKGPALAAAGDQVTPAARPAALDPVERPGRFEQRSEGALDVSTEVASETAAAAEPSLRGRIVGPDGRSIGSGAEVFVLATDPALVLPTGPLHPLAVTDASGGFELPPSALSVDDTPLVMVRAPGLVGYVNVTGDPATARTITLGPELTLSLEVVDEEGAPLEGVQLAGFTDVPRFMAPVGEVTETFGYMPVDPYRHLFGAVTDEAGKGVIRGLFGAHDPSLMVAYAATKPGYARATGALILDRGADPKPQVVLRRTRSLRLAGTARRKDGEPIEDVRVRFRARGEAPLSDAVVARSDAAGRWSIPPEFLDEYPAFLVLEHPEYSASELVVEGPDELDGSPLDVTLRAAVSLGGRVVDEAGEPVADAQVDVTTLHHTFSLRSDAEGRFQCDGLTEDPRSLLVTGTLENRLVSSLSARVDGEETDVVLVLPAGEGVGKVLVRAPKGAAWKHLQLTPIDVTGAAVPSLPDSKAGGEATFERVPAGEWLALGVTDSDQPALVRFEVDPFENSEQRIELAPLGLARVDLVLGPPPGGTPEGPASICTIVARHRDVPSLPGWFLDARTAPTMEFYSEVPPGQTYRFGRLVPGRWQVFAYGPGWSSEPMDVLVEVEAKGGAPARLDLTPSRAASLELRIGPTHRSARAIFACRRAADEAWSEVRIWSLAAGRRESCEIWLPPGQWQWRASIQGSSQGEEYFELVPPLEGSVELSEDGPVTLDLFQ